MITIKAAEGPTRVCLSCSQPNTLFSVRIDADRDQDACLGWSQTLWLCANCLAQLGVEAVLVVGSHFKSESKDG